MGLKYKYTPRLGPKGIEHDPLVDVVFTNPENGKSIEVRALIDSGASSIILHAQFAELLGIELESGIRHLFQGIAYDPVVGYDHTLKIRLKEDTNEYAVECTLMAGLKATAILGQKGFFENYKVVFERYKNRVELTPIPANIEKR